MISKTFPKYFLVDHEIYVKVYFDNKVLVAVNDLGNQYQPYKAMSTGREITEREFTDGSAKRLKQYPKVKAPTSLE